MKETSQIKKWQGMFGKSYTDRNALSLKEMEALYKKTFGISMTKMTLEFVKNLDRNFRILEVGANVGNQLLCLQKIGFKNLYGIEIQDYAVELAKKRTKNINIIQGSAFDIPFKDNFFDLVFTAGVLIHISPKDIKEVLTEIYRCTNRYIMGYESFAQDLAPVNYRGHSDLLWKCNFPNLYLGEFSNLRRVKVKKYKYLSNKNEDIMFLMEKQTNNQEICPICQKEIIEPKISWLPPSFRASRKCHSQCILKLKENEKKQKI